MIPRKLSRRTIGRFSQICALNPMASAVAHKHDDLFCILVNLPHEADLRSPLPVILLIDTLGSYQLASGQRCGKEALDGETESGQGNNLGLERRTLLVPGFSLGKLFLSSADAL